jgi:hypothetical protein
MVFPFAQTYKEKLNSLITPQNQEAILQYIRTTIEKKKAGNIIVESNTVSYKGSTSNLRGSLFRGLDGGKFSLIDSDGGSYLVYEFRMSQFFLIMLIVSIAIAIIFQTWWVALIVFFGLGGLNWILHVDQHENLAIEIAHDINRDFFSKKENVVK